MHSIGAFPRTGRSDRWRTSPASACHVDLLHPLPLDALLHLPGTAQQLPFQRINGGAPVVIGLQRWPRRQPARSQRAVGLGRGNWLGL